MIYRYGYLRREALALLCYGVAVCLVTATGCVDHRYDLKGDLDLSVGVGGKELTIPVGETEKITLEKLIGSDEDDLTVMPDGIYALLKRDDVQMDVAGIAPVTFRTRPFALSEIRPDFGTGVLPPSGSGTPGTGELPAAPIASRGDVKISADIPDEVKSVGRVTFSAPVEARVVFDVSGVSGVVNRMRFENLRVTFPPYIVLAGGGHELVINDEFAAAGGYVCSVGITAMVFDPLLVTDGTVQLDDPVELSGSLRITDIAPGGGDLTGVVLQPALTIGDMQVKLVEGHVEPELPHVQQWLGLQDIPAFLREAGTVLDVNPYINLGVANPLGMQVDVFLGLMPVVGNQENPAGSSNVAMRVREAGTPGGAVLSVFRIAKDASVMPDGYMFVEAPNLPALIRTVPDSILLDVQPALVPGTLQRVDLTVPAYQIRIDYELCVPMTFGPQLSILYRDTVDNLAKDIRDFVDKVQEVKILATVDNTVPLTLQAAAIAVDGQKQPLQGVEVSAPGTIAPGDGGDTPVSSSFDVVIRETQAGALARLDGLILEITAGNNEASAGIPATPRQYVQVRMKLRVPGGLIMDLDDL